jgi:hypothetical protein
LRLRLLALAASCVTVSAVLPATAGQPSPAVVVTRSAHSVSLANGLISRRWALGPTSVMTTALADRVRHRAWTTPGPDFSLTLDGVPTSSVSGWSLAALTTSRVPGGAALHFRYTLAGATLERTVTLLAGSPVMEVGSRLLNGPVPARISDYTLDEVVVPHIAGTEVQAYHGGSDWRDDYRVNATRKGAFNQEGELARLDDGRGNGVFLVSERRGGAMSRVGRVSSGRTWVGVDLARDLFDYGPLQSAPPSYNRLENPAHPVPVRSRLVRPAGTLELGTAFTGVYHGGAAEAGFAFGDFFAKHVAPAYPRSIGLNSFHPWSHGPGMSDANLRSQALLAKKLGVETFMLDDQWQGGAGGESGDWRFDPARFPDRNQDGTPDFVDFLHSQHLNLGLWMSPAEFNTASQTYAAHPDWACAPVGDVTAQVQDDAGLGVWDVTNPSFRAYLTTVIDREVKDWGVTELKFDFQAWLDCGTHDYLDYEDAFVSLVRRLQARHPHVTFELDETNDQRAWPFESAALGPSWFDNGHLHGSTATAKELHDLWSAAPWLPTSSIGYGLLDGTLGGRYTAGYLAPMGLLSHITFWTDQAKIPPAAKPEIRFWLRWYAVHRSDLAGASYELTPSDPLDGRSPMVLQPWTGDHGEVFAFWQAGVKPLTVQLRGVQAGRRYRLTDVRTGQDVTTTTGAALRRGLTLKPSGDYTAQVLTVQPL